MATRKALNASDLFVVLEKAFRRRAPQCCGCTFTIPYPRSADGSGKDDWSVLLTENCSAKCNDILEEILEQARREYQLEG